MTIGATDTAGTEKQPEAVADTPVPTFLTCSCGGQFFAPLVGVPMVPGIGLHPRMDLTQVTQLLCGVCNGRYIWETETNRWVRTHPGILHRADGKHIPQTR